MGDYDRCRLGRRHVGRNDDPLVEKLMAAGIKRAC